ncbi:MAG TPA: glycerol-3-phosphate 1-O-acyltransferase PlsY [Firmicutes bacterium]|nr:glycerol-3-phosphate 1-O-acyltransferase PlsY [Bacillota bacterium]
MGGLVLAVVIAYLLGSVPVGLLIGQIWGRDLRQYGSGNIGTTNALRVLGAKAAVLTLIGDAAKGILGGYLGLLLNGTQLGMVLGALAAIFGQTYPLFLGFKGGKGVATSFGAVLFLSPAMGGVLLAIWLVVVFLTRYVSLSSMTAAACAPLMVYLLKLPPVYYLFAFVAGGHIIYRHKENIKRLLAGKEYKFGERV